MDTVRWAFDQNILQSDFFLKIEDFEGAIAQGKEARLKQLEKNYQSRVWTHIHDEMSPWTCFKENASPSKMPPPSVSAIGPKLSPTLSPLASPPTQQKKKKKKAFWDL